MPATSPAARERLIRLFICREEIVVAGSCKLVGLCMMFCPEILTFWDPHLSCAKLDLLICVGLDEVYALSRGLLMKQLPGKTSGAFANFGGTSGQYERGWTELMQQGFRR